VNDGRRQKILLLGQSNSGKTALAALICDILSQTGDAESRSYYELDAEDSTIPGTTIQGSLIEYRQPDPEIPTQDKRHIIDWKNKQTSLRC